jgi:hypothetical protein
MKISDKIIERINKEFGLDIPKSQRPRRLYHGHWQRSEGAWSWCVGGNLEFQMCYGSQFTMKELLKEKYIILFREHGSDVAIIPATEKEYLEYKSEHTKKKNNE